MTMLDNLDFFSTLTGGMWNGIICICLD